MKKIIKDSYNLFNRQYLFENLITKKPITSATLLTCLRTITKLPGITNNIMRVSYITSKYSKNINHNDKNILASSMRNTIGAADKYYNKIINNDVNNINDDKDNEIIILKQKISELEQQLKTTDENKIIDKHFNKKRINIIYLLKRGNIVKDSTLKTYNILYDENKQKYI